MERSKVTVLMPAHNAESFIFEAISSILNQTYEDFSLIVLDDGSTDDTLKIAKSFENKDSRIIVHSEPLKRGIPWARDFLLTKIRSEYFAWMDADDVAFPERLAEQISYLDSHPNVGAVSCSFQDYESGAIVSINLSEAELKARMLMENIFLNPGAMVRTSLLQKINFSFLESGVPSATDYAFWKAMWQVAPLAVLPKVLMRYRRHPLQESTHRISIQNASAKRLISNEIRSYGIDVPDWVEPAICLYANERARLKQVKHLGQIYISILEKNTDLQVYDQENLKWQLSIWYRRMCRFVGPFGVVLFLKAFGVREIFRGKNWGANFIFDCWRFRPSRVNFPYVGE